MSDLEYIRKRFKDDRFAVDVTGAEILSAEPGHSICEAEIRPHHLNAVNAVMGGVIFTLADFAFAVAANTDTEIITVSQQASVNFLSPVRGKKLIAEANVLKKGKRTSLYSVEVKDDLDTSVAYVTVTGYSLPQK